VTDGHLVVREARDEADLATLVAITVAVTPDEPNSLENLRWADATYPGATRLLAELDGRPVGAATVGRIYVLPADFDGFWATIVVLPEARRRGVGGGLLSAVSDRARAAGKMSLHIPASEERPDGIAFLCRRGFDVYERSKIVRLGLAGLEPPPIEPPAGVSLTTLAARPDLVEGVHAVAVEAFADIPGGDEPTAPGDLAEFIARDVERPSVPAEAFFVAVDDATDRVVGYASLLLLPGRSDAAWHDMTAVVRAWRGRGLALALKHATIGWAIANGLTELVTGNDVENAPMRAINAKLGYRPTPDRLVLRGPLFDGIMDR
jgi:GNAT superfamily N-acetyltransferase